MSRRSGIGLALLAAVAMAAAAAEVPFLSGRVVDEAGLLSAQARSRISGELEGIERSTGDQVAVLIVRSLGGEPLADYSHTVAQTWGLGGKGKDNGVLFLIAVGERRMRLEVGYGLEGVLPDALAGRILDDVVQPFFKRGDFDGGVEAGVKAIAAVLGGNPEAVPKRPPAGGGQVAGAASSVFMLIFAFLVLLSAFRRHRRGRGMWGPVIVPWGGGFGGGRGGGGFGGGGFSGGGGSFGGGGASGGW